MTSPLSALRERAEKAIHSLVQLCEQVGGLPNDHHLMNRLHDLKRSLVNNELTIEIIHNGIAPSEGWAGVISSDGQEILKEKLKIAELGLSVEVNSFFHANAPVRQAGALLPPIKFIFNTNDNEEADLIWWAKQLKEGGVLICVNSNPPNELPKGENAIVLPIKLDQLPDNYTFPLTDETLKKKIAWIYIKQFGVALEKISEGLKYYLSNEQSDVSILKTQTSQEAKMLQSSEKINYREWFTKFKGEFQKSLADLESEIVQTIDYSFSKGNNSISKELKTLIDELNEFEENEKHDYVQISIPTGFIQLTDDLILSKSKLTIESAASALIENFQSLNRDAKSKVKSLFPESDFQFNFHLNKYKLNDLLSDITVIQKEFSGEIPKKDYTLYLKGIREPLGIMALGVMLIGALQMKKLTVNLNLDTIKWFFVVVLIFSIIFFLRRTLKNFELNRQDKTQKELQKAREFLLVEYSKSLSMIVKNTKQAAIDELKRFQIELQEAIEDHLHVQMEYAKVNSQERELNLSRKMKGVEIRERSLIEFDRQFALFSKNLEQWNSDWKKQFFVNN
jgi:hypothetical protein